MFCTLRAAELVGLDCVPVNVEVDLHKGQTNFAIVGLANAAIKEAKDRLYAAIKNAGFNYPFNFRIVINLAPADLHKEGSAYDLPMALGIVALSNGWQFDVQDALVVGELALDGNVRHVRGVLPLALWARDHGLKRLFVPADNAEESTLVDGLVIFPVHHLGELVEHLQGKRQIEPFVGKAFENEVVLASDLDFSLIKGHHTAKRALEVAASGGHNVLMSGPPGSGKTLLARSLPSILPPLTEQEKIEVTMVYSVAETLKTNLVKERPFRSPHHTASGAALIGGGHIPRPGEISMAHRGVLFLDEFPEFSRGVIESLRQPLEDGVVTVARAERTVSFPARFMLIASQNPCPCGYASDPEHPCVCTGAQLARYNKKISGPLLDRIDILLEVPRLPVESLMTSTRAEPSSAIRERVLMARERQTRRFKGLSIHTNSEMQGEILAQFCEIDQPSWELVRQAVERYKLSARAYNRVLKVSRTIADLAGSENIQLPHLAEALQFRLS
ncbi:MAG: hypothetical protein A3I29_01415 [Candidatus Magasanikbacteria bacterium RIFCSPLOWO2_02_FULL_44_11]|uniref:MCM C-terminal AAA(+) ATPase domain-containing protein n=2 Tax=Candidatus Magasanikiibacteriota TaxID=1752731 RepID=A0A1F6N8U7_9BACT|nr:MAG: hypothetical protein A3I29_01415 [Candidatus Magasanikbacteria bacterium RIFCSPLOWO2_02_FULL_44_11]